MLLWAEVEIIFFIVAGMRLCFGFVLLRVLIIQRCFSCQGLFSFLCCQVHGNLGGDTARTADPTGQMGCSIYHMTSCSAYKAEGRRTWETYLHTSKSKQGMYSLLPIGRQVFSHSQESRAPSHVTVTLEDKTASLRIFPLPSSSPSFLY